MRSDIIAADLTEGDLFMTESEVTRRYAVSRNIAREAVSQLRGLGILMSRQGKGLLVAHSDPLARSLPFYGREPEDLKHLAQWRYVLEMGAVELAVNEATPEQTDRLEALARKYEELGSRDYTEKEDNAVELAFHSLILEMTGNPLIAGIPARRQHQADRLQLLQQSHRPVHRGRRQRLQRRRVQLSHQPQREDESALQTGLQRHDHQQLLHLLRRAGH